MEYRHSDLKVTEERQRDRCRGLAGNRAAAGSGADVVDEGGFARAQA